MNKTSHAEEEAQTDHPTDVTQATSLNRGWRSAQHPQHHNDQTKERPYPEDLPNRLIRDNTQILFLPATVIDQHDSHGEPYLICDCPESAISLNTQPVSFALHISGGGPIEVPILLHDLSKPDAVKPIPARIEGDSYREAARYISELPPSSADIILPFIGWLRLTQPTTRTQILSWFMDNPNGWLIGFRNYSDTIHYVQTIPLETRSPWTWFSLTDLLATL